MEKFEPDHPDVALARFFRAHHAAIGVDELRLLGFKKDAVTRLVSRERLLRVHRGVYRSGNAPATHETFLRCALLAVGDDAAIARSSAAHHRGHIKYPPGLIEVVVPRRGVGRTRSGLLVHSAAELTDRDVTIVNGLRETAPHRTLLDLASATRSSSDYRLLRRAIRQATVEDRGLPVRMAALLDRAGRIRGSRVLRTLLREHLDTTALLRSNLEADFLDLIRVAGLPMPETNAKVEGLEVDALWHKERVAVELDTYGTHGGVRSFEGDRERDAILTLAGYRPIRITERRMQENRDEVERLMHGLLRPATTLSWGGAVNVAR